MAIDARTLGRVQRGKRILFKVTLSNMKVLGKWFEFENYVFAESKEAALGIATKAHTVWWVVGVEATAVYAFGAKECPKKS